MTIRDIMIYIESEYSVINYTPCELCGGGYMATDLSLEIVDGMPFDICDCTCLDCGHEKIFEFCAPFVDQELSNNIKNFLN